MGRFLFFTLLVLVGSLISKHHAAEEEWMKCFKVTDYEELVNIARDGLAKTSKPKVVVVVGAGISGFTAAKLLKEAGHQVHILEASDRVGGREKDWYVDLGPMRLPKVHRREKVAAVNENAELFGYELDPSEKGRSPNELFVGTFDKVTKNCTILREKYDSYTIKEYLIKEGNLSRGAVDMIGDIRNEDAGFHTSFLNSVVRYATFANDSSFEEITGGFDQLPNAFAQELSGIIRLNTRVEMITRLNKKVRVFFRKMGSRTLSWLTADYVLVTATTRATRLIKFQPPLSNSKAHALRSFHYTTSTKIALACTDRFWEREGIRGGRSVTERPSQVIYYPNHGFPSGLGVLLVSYTTHDPSEFFLPLSEERCLDVVMDDLSEVHNISKYYLKSVCNKHVIQKWSLDNFSMGAYAAPTPYQLSHFFEALFQNEGWVYFAGEHTGLPHAWIDTSMKSAIRAASSIHLDRPIL